MPPFPTRFTVLATDATRPGWSFVWGGSPTRDQADAMVAEFVGRSGTKHLTFIVRDNNVKGGDDR